MASKEDYERIKNLTSNEIIEIAKHCCGDIVDEAIEVNIDDAMMIMTSLDSVVVNVLILMLEKVKLILIDGVDNG